MLNRSQLLLLQSILTSEINREEFRKEMNALRSGEFSDVYLNELKETKKTLDSVVDRNTELKDVKK